MGLETTCKVILNGVPSQGKAHCGDGEVDFRGEFRFRWLWKDLSVVESAEGVLHVSRAGDHAEFHLNDSADKWAHAIRNPKSRLDKLGLKPGQAYQAWGDFDSAFPGELEERAGLPSEGSLDAVFIRMDSDEDLTKLNEARAQIGQAGMIWAVWPKGRKEFREDDIRDYALRNELVDVKVASFSDSLSALKLVIPVALRTK